MGALLVKSGMSSQLSSWPLKVMCCRSTRRNWLFSATPAGANASANLYSLIETAKANGLEPYAYLRHIFTELPRAATVDDIEAMLAWHLDPDRLRQDPA